MMPATASRSCRLSSPCPGHSPLPCFPIFPTAARPRDGPRRRQGPDPALPDGTRGRRGSRARGAAHRQSPQEIETLLARRSPPCPAPGHEQPHGLQGDRRPDAHECRAPLAQAGGQVLRGQPHDGRHRGTRGSPRPSAFQSCSATSSSTTTPTEGEIAAAFAKGVEEARIKGTAIIIGHVQNTGVVDILRAGEDRLAAPAACGLRASPMSCGSVKGDGAVKILGIESSCDECSASVVEDGRRILSNSF